MKSKSNMKSKSKIKSKSNLKSKSNMKSQTSIHITKKNTDNIDKINDKNNKNNILLSFISPNSNYLVYIYSNHIKIFKKNNELLPINYSLEFIKENSINNIFVLLDNNIISKKNNNNKSKNKKINNINYNKINNLENKIYLVYHKKPEFFFKFNEIYISNGNINNNRCNNLKKPEQNIKNKSIKNKSIKNKSIKNKSIKISNKFKKKIKTKGQISDKSILKSKKKSLRSISDIKLIKKIKNHVKYFYEAKNKKIYYIIIKYKNKYIFVSDKIFIFRLRKDEYITEIYHNFIDYLRPYFYTNKSGYTSSLNKDYTVNLSNIKRIAIKKLPCLNLNLFNYYNNDGEGGELVEEKFLGLIKHIQYKKPNYKDFKKLNTKDL
jgi:hypothetical protein